LKLVNEFLNDIAEVEVEVRRAQRSSDVSKRQGDEWCSLLFFVVAIRAVRWVRVESRKVGWDE
jgi:hypothetical protein